MGLLQRLAGSNGNQERKEAANALIKDRLDSSIVRDWLEDMKAEIEYKRAIKAAEKGRF